MNDYEKTSEACEAAFDLVDTVLCDVQDSDIALLLEDAKEKIRRAQELAEERA